MARFLLRGETILPRWWRCIDHVDVAICKHRVGCVCDVHEVFLWTRGQDIATIRRGNQTAMDRATPRRDWIE